MNRVILTGRLTKSVNLKFTKSGIAQGDFNLAVDANYQKEGQDTTNYIRCVVWRKAAENLSNFTVRGSKILVEGHLDARTYEENGERKFITEVVVDRFELLDTKAETDRKREILSMTGRSRDEFEDLAKNGRNTGSVPMASKEHTNYDAPPIKDSTEVDIDQTQLPF